MKSSVLLLALILCFSCQNTKTEKTLAKKEISVELNKNIHTSHIIELFVWPGEYPSRPIVIKAQEYFAPFKNHPAVTLSDSLLKNEIFYFDELTEILLYLEKFPGTKFKYPLENSPYAGRTEIIRKWIEHLSKFYVDANVEKFLNQNQQFYLGAREEVMKNLPPENFINDIEEYYRASKIKYTIIPAPEMPTGGAYGYRGIGPYVYTPKGMEIYQVISASLPVEKDSATGIYKNFGFDNRQFILRNSYHEFGHAFVNTILSKEENEKILNQYSHLFIDELKDVMLKQNYDNWFDCLAEHIVRLGEIRLAERSGDKAWANDLRNYHTTDLNFVFLPEFEKKIQEYEKDKSYKTFEDFLPELLSVLNGFNSEKIKQRIKSM